MNCPSCGGYNEVGTSTCSRCKASLPKPPPPAGNLYIAAAILILGLGILVSRVYALSFSSTPKDATLAQIKSAKGYDYVRFDKSKLRTDQVFYCRTDLPNMPCARTDPRMELSFSSPQEVYQAGAASVGARVTLMASQRPEMAIEWKEGILKPRRPGQWMHELGFSDFETVTSVRYVAMFPDATELLVVESGKKMMLSVPVFVFSPWYPANEDPGQEGFLAQGTYSGMLVDQETDPFFRKSIAKAGVSRLSYLDLLAVMVAPAAEVGAVRRFMVIEGAEGLFFELPDGVDVDAVPAEGVAYTVLDDDSQSNHLRLFVNRRLARNDAPYPRVRAIAAMTPSLFVTGHGVPSKVHPLGAIITCIGALLMAFHLRAVLATR